MHEDENVDEGNVSGKQEEKFDPRPVTRPDEGDLLRQRQ